jgi:phage portal protein BeeE
LLDGDALEIEFDFANLMRGDAASRSAYYQSGIQNGWLTRNEARISENLNPIAGPRSTAAAAEHGRRG